MKGFFFEAHKENAGLNSTIFIVLLVLGSQ